MIFPETYQAIQEKRDERHILNILGDHHPFPIKELLNNRWLDIDQDGKADDLLVLYNVDASAEELTRGFGDVFLRHENYWQIAFHDAHLVGERRSLDYLEKDGYFYLIDNRVAGSGRFLYISIYVFHDSGSFKLIYNNRERDIWHSDGLLIITGKTVRIRDAADEYRLVISGERVRLGVSPAPGE